MSLSVTIALRTGDGVWNGETDWFRSAFSQSLSCLIFAMLFVFVLSCVRLSVYLAISLLWGRGKGGEVIWNNIQTKTFVSGKLKESLQHLITETNDLRLCHCSWLLSFAPSGTDRKCSRQKENSDGYLNNHKTQTNASQIHSTKNMAWNTMRTHSQNPRVLTVTWS